MELEGCYVDFLRSERGLADRSVLVYAPYVHAFLLHCVAGHGSAALSKLNVAKVQRFLLHRAQGRSSEWVRLLAVALRSFFRFLYQYGKTDRDLSPCVPTVRKWSQATVPACLSPEEVEQALGVPDRSVARGRREYAMLLLLARLGLRAGEIVALELGDLHWRAAEITIHGKGKQVDTLPLPADVGQAIADYLRAGRGASTSRQVFLRIHAPRVALTDPGAIGHIVRRVLAQAGIRRRSRGAAHLFRHSLASRMIQHGATLNEISEVLRHQSLTTTEIYAKVDLRSLREVARPWPCTGGVR
jgi:site-specific recombinase XerD